MDGCIASKYGRMRCEGATTVTDFLARLVTTSSATEADVAPRLPSLFEPMHLGPALDTAAEGAGATAMASSEEGGPSWAAPHPADVAPEPTESMGWHATISTTATNEPSGPQTMPQDRAPRPPVGSRVRQPEPETAPPPPERDATQRLEGTARAEGQQDAYPLSEEGASRWVPDERTARRPPVGPRVRQSEPEMAPPAPKSDTTQLPNGAAFAEPLQDEPGAGVPEQSPPDSQRVCRARAMERAARRQGVPLTAEPRALRNEPGDDLVTTGAATLEQMPDEDSHPTGHGEDITETGVPASPKAWPAALPSPGRRQVPEERGQRLVRQITESSGVSRTWEQLSPLAQSDAQEEAGSIPKERSVAVGTSSAPRAPRPTLSPLESASPATVITGEQSGSPQRPAMMPRATSREAPRDEQREASLARERATSSASPHSWEERLNARLAALAIVPRETAIQDSRSDLTPPAAPPPTIHVTIGRIEVRATPPAAPPRKTTAQPPVMSLEDYMRQRAEGGRR